MVSSSNCFKLTSCRLPGIKTKLVACNKTVCFTHNLDALAFLFSV